MQRSQGRRPRRAFTLIELLVVIALIVLVSTLGYFTLGAFSGPNNVSSGASNLSGWLLIAKQRAKRDGVPTGVRISKDPTTGYYSIVQYIQQPDAYSAVLANGNPSHCTQVLISQQSANAPIVTQASFDVIFTNVSYGAPGTVEQFPVAVGDWLVINDGPPHRIAQISGAALVLDNNTTLPVDPATMLPLNSYPRAQSQSFTPTASAPSNYRIIRQPRLIAGEETLNLPGSVGIEDPTKPVMGFKLSTPPQAGTDANGNPYYEILFSPSGSVIGQGTPSGQIYLWVRDQTVDNSADVTAGYATILAIQVRSGFIAAQPPGTNNDPFFFTRDARASGI